MIPRSPCVRYDQSYKEHALMRFLVLANSPIISRSTLYARRASPPFSKAFEQALGRWVV